MFRADATTDPPPRAMTIDWLLVLAVAGVSSAGVGLEQPWAGSSWALAASGLATGLPLALRRTYPVLSAGLVGTALVLQVVLGGSLHFGSFLAALIAMFSVARHEPSPRWALVGALLLGGGVLGASADGLSQSPSEIVFPLFYLSADWFLGRAVRVLEERTVRLHELNEALARDRESSARLAVAGERIRLARELHDVVAHTVMVMVWQAEAAEELLDRGESIDRPREALRTIQDAGRRGLADLRTLVGVLRDDAAAEGTPGLDELVGLAALMSGSGLTVDLALEVPSHLRDQLPTGLEPALYRLVQESLTNVIRHSQAVTAAVSIQADPGTLQVRVADSGPRRSSPRPGSGHGVAGMRERITALGGTLAAGAHDEGYVVHAVVPLAGVGS